MCFGGHLGLKKRFIKIISLTRSFKPITGEVGFVIYYELETRLLNCNIDLKSMDSFTGHIILFNGLP